MPRKPAKQHVNFRMPVEMVQFIDERAERNGLTRTELLLKMIEFSQMNIDWTRVRNGEFDAVLAT